MFGTIVGRFYLKQDLGLNDDDTPNTVTISELIETFPLWLNWIEQFSGKRVQLFTMFETTDVHPDIIECMKKFDRVIVPYDYLKVILQKHGVNCEALNWYTSPLIREAPEVIEKSKCHDKQVFLYVGTNDVRKNTVKLATFFSRILNGTKHMLIMKTNTTNNLPISNNIKYLTKRLSNSEMAGLYNICDYVVSFSHGEGVGLPMLEAAYFKKPVITHTGGVLSTIQNDNWIELPYNEIRIDKENVPPFLQKVFHGTWWEVDEKETLRIINNLIQ